MELLKKIIIIALAVASILFLLKIITFLLLFFGFKAIK